MDVKNDLSGGKPTLLIAEDEESNYLLLKTILHKVFTTDYYSIFYR